MKSLLFGSFLTHWDKAPDPVPARQVIDVALRGYLVCVATDAPAPEGMVEWDIPAATYAVFDCVGPASEAIGRTTHRSMTEWLPSSGYEWAQRADVEVYFGPRMTDEDYRSQI